MQHYQRDEHSKHEAFLCCEDALADIGVDIQNPSVKFLAGLRVFTDEIDHVLDLIYLHMDSLDMLPLGVDDDFFLKMVAVDIDILILVSFSIENGHSVLHCEIDLQVLAEVHDLGHAVDYHILFGLKV